MHCDREPLDGSCFGETVFIPKTEDPLLYDGKLIHMKHPTVIKVLKIGQDHAAYHIPVFIDKDRNDTANLNWYGHVAFLIYWHGASQTLGRGFLKDWDKSLNF